MALLVSNPWLAVVVPFALALMVALVPRATRALAPTLVSLGSLTTLAVGVASLATLPAAGHAAGGGYLTSVPVSVGSIPWFRVGATVLELGWVVDSLTAVMLVVVGVVATCVIVFSAGYMHGDKGWARYFALIALFTGSMNVLVIADSFVTLFVGWELVGACSYLLIGFWYEKPSAAAAAVKAFLTTRVGDVGLLLGIAVLWVATGSTTYAGTLSALGGVSSGAVVAAALCIAVGAMGKSAQFPLHAWLPDAMEGPTPVSALIHAATMVAAGVFLVVRVWPLFEAAPQAQLLLLAVGAISAFGAALAAVAQSDIKKVLAYSTISQLGLMFAALGAGAWEAAFFHLVTHAAFKALLFLGSGSVIHGSGTQDLHEMGGLRKAMPVTFVTWVIGVLALSGVFPLAGFFSKDAVLEAVLHSAPGVGVLLFGASALTAFYCARATRLAFFGPPSEGLHAHESGPSMLAPLVVLSIAAAGLGLSGSWLATVLGAEPEPLALGVSAAALGLAALGGVAGWMASAGPAGDLRTAARMPRLWAALKSAFGWDALVDRVVVRPTLAASRALWAIGDRLIADGAAEGAAGAARWSGRLLGSLQTGNAQSYSTAIAIGVLLMLVASVWWGR